MARYFRKELVSLSKSATSGQFQAPTPGSLDGLETDGSLDFMADMTPIALERAPHLMRFFGLLSKSVHKRDEIDLNPKSAQSIWASMCLYLMGKKKFNNIPKLFGLYLLQNGVKKRIIDIMSSIGFCTSYTTTLECQKTLRKSRSERKPSEFQEFEEPMGSEESSESSGSDSESSESSGSDSELSESLGLELDGSLD
ncbi:hypothetical protein MMC12_003194 [Toensbergia leucococca]|nr:hypothetical protein [Toensbergia leucococca]